MQRAPLLPLECQTILRYMLLCHSTLVPRSATFAAICWLPVSVHAQVAPAPAAAVDGKDAPIVLSPFTVSNDKDVGYLAPDTLSGSRLNTNLKDLASSISVFTEEFLSDLGATDLTTALTYANNVELALNDAASAAAPNNNILVTQFQDYRVRGMPATRAVNFFEWEIPIDTYNVSRIEDARGPNSVLFGIAEAGGLLNSTTKQPLLGRSFRKISAVYSSHDSLRGTFDVNQVAGADKLAVRVNALSDETKHFRRHMFDHDERAHVGIKYRFSPATTVRLEYEAGTIKGNVARPFNLTDGVLPWLAAGRPRLNAPVANPQAPPGTVRLPATARVTYIANTGQLLNMAQHMTTNGSSTIIQDPALTDRSINVSGPGALRTADFSTLSAYFEHKIGQETFLEFAYNRQRHTMDARDPTVSSSDLKGEPNNFLPGGAPNPHAGGLLLEAAWFRTVSANEADTFRGMFATAHDAGKWGNYRFALMGEYRDAHVRSSQQGEFWAGAPFHANPENGANQVWRRFYVTEGDWGSYHVDGELQYGPIVNLSDPISGRTLSSSWIARQQGSADVPTKLKSFVAGLQPRFFGGRLVGNFGYRVDQLDTIDRNENVRDPATNILVVDYANGLDVDFTGETRTYGVVGHVTRNLSVLGNYATNLGLPNPRSRIVPGRNAPARTGEGKDVGIAASLLDGRLYARAVYFETAGQNLTGARGVAALETTNNQVLNALVSAGLITAAQADERSLNSSNVMTFDQSSEGYEFQLTANLTRDWRLIANYSATEGTEQNVGSEVKPWIADNFAFWRTFNQDTVTSRGLTIAQELANITNTLDEQFETEGDINFGNRKHKVNLFTRYGFSSGPLRGLSAGAGYRHQSKIVVGRSPTGGNVYGNSFSRFDAMLGYQVRGLPKDLKLGLQLNVTNVLDDRDPLILRYQGTGVRRYALSAGREWRLAANLEF